MTNKYLTEENYKRIKNLLILVSVLILVIGLGSGVYLITKGLQYSGKLNINGEPIGKIIADEKQNLLTKREELVNKNESVAIIDVALSELFPRCDDFEVKTNVYTEKYCSLKNSIENKDSFFTFGVFIIFVSCSISGVIFENAIKRELAAFKTQQVMPVVKEGIDEMTPTIKNVTREISKGIKSEANNDKE